MADRSRSATAVPEALLIIRPSPVWNSRWESVPMHPRLFRGYRPRLQTGQVQYDHKCRAQNSTVWRSGGM